MSWRFGRIPSSAEEGWREAPGWCWSRELISWTNRPAASRHPALNKAGSSRTFQFIHTFDDRRLQQTQILNGGSHDRHKAAGLGFSNRMRGVDDRYVRPGARGPARTNGTLVPFPLGRE